MKIEDINQTNLRDLQEIELRNLRSRFINIYDHHFAKSSLQKTTVNYRGFNLDINREELIMKYIILRQEMSRRELKIFKQSSLDVEVYNRLFKRSLWELDIPTMGDIVAVNEYISISGSFVKSPKEANDIDIVIREDERNRDESLEVKVGRTIKEQTQKEPHFIYSPRGPHSSYIPVFDLVLRARDDTKKVKVKEAAPKDKIFQEHKKARPNERAYYQGLDNWDIALQSDNSLVMKNLSQGSVLDLGCGACKLLKILENAGRKVTGVDKSDVAKDMCTGRAVEFVKVDLEKEDLPFEDNSFDNVISVHTMEHLELPEKLIKDACRVAKKKVIILSPLGKRLDPTHKQKFLTVNDFKAHFGRQWIVSENEESNSAIAVRDFELEKAALAPFGSFTPPKPTMAGLTEAFSVEQIWDWAKDKFPLDVEEKLNGFRFIIEKAGARIRLKTEGNKDRTKQLPMIEEALGKIPDDFIADCSMGIEKAGKALPRIKIMTLMADKPEFGEGEVPKATLFDLPYWKEDLHEKPLSERRKALESFYNKYLKASPYFGVTSYNIVKDRAGLEAKFKTLSQLSQSEGILLKTLDGTWDTDGSCNTWAKLKHEAEIKVIALERHEAAGGNYNYTCGLLPGESAFENLTEFQGKKYIDLGKCFNTKIKAEPGDILTIGIEEIIPKEKTLHWLGARVIDIDEDRKEPYAANQVIGIAERANILQKAKEGGIDYEIGDTGRGSLQIHFMGVKEEELPALNKISREAANSRHSPMRLKMLLKGAIGEHGCHLDVRLVRKGNDYFEGGEIMVGNFSGLDKVKKLEEGGKLRFGWKVPHAEEPSVETIRGPVSWMDAGKGHIEIFKPGEAGATSNLYGAMLLLDSFTWEAIEPQDKHAKKFNFNGTKFIPEGTYLMAYVPVTAAGEKGERVWMISRLKETEEKKLDLGRFRAEGVDDDIANPKKRYRELIADLRYLGNSGYPKIKAGEEWGEWALKDLLQYFAKIVDVLRSIYFPIVPPKLGDKKFNTSYWQCYRDARKHMKSEPPSEEEAKQWDKKREAIIEKAGPPRFNILKVDKAKQIVGGIIYEPEEEDTQGDYTDAAEIEKAMYRFMEKYATNSKRIRINHEGKKYFFPILECFQPDHDTIKGDQRLKAGSWWLMIKITNNKIWEDIESGKLTGFSMGGRAKA